jgi:hypothetical protein
LIFENCGIFRTPHAGIYPKCCDQAICQIARAVNIRDRGEAFSGTAVASIESDRPTGNGRVVNNHDSVKSEVNYDSQSHKNIRNHNVNGAARSFDGFPD